MFKKIVAFLNNPNEGIQERSFILLSVIGFFTTIISFVLDLLFNLITKPVMSLEFTGFFFALIAISGLIGFKSRLLLWSRIFTALTMVFIFLPLSFFKGGGIYGSMPVWLVFSALYAVLILEGKLKWFTIISGVSVTLFCLYFGYMYPIFLPSMVGNGLYLEYAVNLSIMATVISTLIGYNTRLHIKANLMAEAQKKEIEEMSRAQSGFFSNMSHEIRTPINTILG
ncbi:MAG: hypothetical protein K6F00_02265, partial [Lachnospiraceae bacterium]|nr:hypothetical protein [Lachnospiraceae bacterium]